MYYGWDNPVGVERQIIRMMLVAGPKIEMMRKAYPVGSGLINML